MAVCASSTDDAARYAALRLARSRAAAQGPTTTDKDKDKDSAVSLLRRLALACQHTAMQQGLADGSHSTTVATHRSRLISVRRRPRDPSATSPAQPVRPRPTQTHVNEARWLASLTAFAEDALAAAPSAGVGSPPVVAAVTEGSTIAATVATTASPARTRKDMALAFETLPFPRRSCPLPSPSQRAQRYAQRVVRTAYREPAATGASHGITLFTSLPSRAAGLPTTTVTPQSPPPPPPTLSAQPVPESESQTGPTEAYPVDVHAGAGGEVSSRSSALHRRVWPASVSDESSSLDGGLVGAAARLLGSTTTMLFSPSARELLTRSEAPPCRPALARPRRHRARSAQHRQHDERWMAHWESQRAETQRRAAPATSHGARQGEWYAYSFGITTDDLRMTSVAQLDMKRADKARTCAASPEPDCRLHEEVNSVSSRRSRSGGASRSPSDMDDSLSGDGGDSDNGKGVGASRRQRDTRPRVYHSMGRDAREAQAAPGTGPTTARTTCPMDAYEDDDLSFSFFASERDARGSGAHSRANMSSSNSFASLLDDAAVDDDDDDENNDDADAAEKGRVDILTPSGAARDGAAEVSLQGVAPPRNTHADSDKDMPDKTGDTHDGTDDSLSYASSFALHATSGHTSPRPDARARLAATSSSPSHLHARAAHMAYLFTPVPRTTPLPPSPADRRLPRPAESASPCAAQVATCVRFTPSGEGYLVGTRSGVLWYVPSHHHHAPPLQVTALGTVHRQPTTHRAAGVSSAESSAGVNPWWMEDLQGHSDAILSLDFNDDGTLFCSSSLDGSVIIWSTERRDKVRRMQIAAVTTHATTSTTTTATAAEDEVPSEAAVRATAEDALQRVRALSATARRGSQKLETRTAPTGRAATTASLSLAPLASVRTGRDDACAAPCQASFVPLNNNFLLVLTQLPEGALRLFNCSTGLAVVHVAVGPAPSTGLPAAGENARHPSHHHNNSHNNSSTDRAGGGSATRSGGVSGFFSSLFSSGPSAVTAMVGPAPTAPRTPARTSASAPSPLESVMTTLAVTVLAAPLFFTGDASGRVHVWSFRNTPLTPLPTLRPERRPRRGSLARGASPSSAATSGVVPLLAMPPRQLPGLRHVCACVLPGSAVSSVTAGVRAVGRLEVAAMNAAQACAWIAAAASSEAVGKKSANKTAASVPTAAVSAPLAATTSTAAASAEHGTVQRLFHQLSTTLSPAVAGAATTTAAAAAASAEREVDRGTALLESLMPLMLVASQPSDVFHVLGLTQRTHATTSSAAVAATGAASSEVRRAPSAANRRASQTRRALPNTCPSSNSVSATTMPAAPTAAVAVTCALVVLHTVRGVCRLRHVLPWCAPLSAHFGRGGGAGFCTDNALRPVVSCVCDEGFVYLLTVPLRTRLARHAPARAADGASTSVSSTPSAVMAPLARLALPGGGVCSDLAWSPQSRFLVAVTTDGWVYEWERLYLWCSGGGRGSDGVDTATSATRAASESSQMPARATDRPSESLAAAGPSPTTTAVAADEVSMAAASDPHARLDEEERRWRQQVYDARQAQRLAWLRAHPEALISSNSEEESSLCASRLGMDSSDTGDASF